MPESPRFMVPATSEVLVRVMLSVVFVATTLSEPAPISVPVPV